MKNNINSIIIYNLFHKTFSVYQQTSHNSHIYGLEQINTIFTNNLEVFRRIWVFFIWGNWRNLIWLYWDWSHFLRNWGFIVTIGKFHLTAKIIIISYNNLHKVFSSNLSVVFFFPLRLAIIMWFYTINLFIIIIVKNTFFYLPYIYTCYMCWKLSNKILILNVKKEIIMTIFK